MREPKLSAQQVVDRLALLLRQELRYRDMSISDGDATSAKDRYGNWPDGFVQMDCFIPYQSDERDWSIDQYAEKYLTNIARDCALKLSRPFPVTLYDMDLPLGCLEAVRSLHGLPRVRMLSAYSITKDKFLTRFDVLASWQESTELHPMLSHLAR